MVQSSSSLHWAGDYRKSVVAATKIRQPLIRQRSGGFKLGAASPAVSKLAGLDRRSLGWRSSICSAKAQNGGGAGGCCGAMPSFFREPTPVCFEGRNIAPSVRSTWPRLPLRVGDNGRSRVRRIPRASPLVDAAKRKARVCVKRRRTHSAASFGVTVTPQRGCEREGVFDVLRCPSRRLDPARGVAATRPPSPPCPAPCPSDLVAQKYVFQLPPAQPRQPKICQSSPADQIPAKLKNARSRTAKPASASQ